MRETLKSLGEKIRVLSMNNSSLTTDNIKLSRELALLKDNFRSLEMSKENLDDELKKISSKTTDFYLELKKDFSYNHKTLEEYNKIDQLLRDIYNSVGNDFLIGKSAYDRLSQKILIGDI